MAEAIRNTEEKFHQKLLVALEYKWYVPEVPLGECNAR